MFHAFTGTQNDMQHMKNNLLEFQRAMHEQGRIAMHLETHAEKQLERVSTCNKMEITDENTYMELFLRGINDINPLLVPRRPFGRSMWHEVLHSKFWGIAEKIIDLLQPSHLGITTTHDGVNVFCVCAKYTLPSHLLEKLMKKTPGHVWTKTDSHGVMRALDFLSNNNSAETKKIALKYMPDVMRAHPDYVVEISM